MFPKHPTNQQGFSVLLAIMIMSSLTIMTIAAADVVLRVSKSSRNIGQSEVAHFAAESAVEKALYYIEKADPRTLIIPDGGSGVLEEVSGVTWSRQITENNSVSPQCISFSGFQLGCITSSGEITSSSPLILTLENGSSFQLEFNFTGLTLSTSINITCSKSATVILQNLDGQTSQSCPDPVNDLDIADGIIKIRNEFTGPSPNTITLTPNDGNLPVGIIVIGTGVYQDQVRILEIERTNWQIY